MHHKNCRIVCVPLADVENIQGVEICVYWQSGFPEEVFSSLAPGERFSRRIFHLCEILNTGGGIIAGAYGQQHQSKANE